MDNPANLIVLALAATVVSSVLRNQLPYVIGSIGLRIRSMGEFLAYALWSLNTTLGCAISAAARGLQYRGPNHADELSPWTGWAVLNPVLNSLIVFMPLALADLELNGLRLGGLFGQPASWTSPFGMDRVGGALMLMVTVALGLALWDVLGGVPGAYVWQNLRRLWRAVLSIVFAAALVVNIAAAILLAVWGQAATDDLTVPGIEYPTLWINLLLMGALHVAVLASGAGLPALGAVVVMLALAVTRVVCIILWLTVCVIVIAFDALLHVPVLIPVLLAIVGIWFFNWICSFRWSDTFVLYPATRPIMPTLPRPNLGPADVVCPAWAEVRNRETQSDLAPQSRRMLGSA
jgi:hypothetical protein